MVSWLIVCAVMVLYVFQSAFLRFQVGVLVVVGVGMWLSWVCIR